MLLGGKGCFLAGDRIVDGVLDVPDVIRSKVWCCFAMFGLMEARAEVGGAVGADVAVWGTHTSLPVLVGGSWDYGLPKVPASAFVTCRSAKWVCVPRSI